MFTNFPSIDLTLTLSGVLAVSSILSGILATIINNRYQLKLHTMDLRQRNTENTTHYYRDIFEKYLKACSKHLKDYGVPNHIEYTECYLTALLYAPDAIASKMQTLDTCITSGKSPENVNPSQLVREITMLLNKWLQTMSL